MISLKKLATNQRSFLVIVLVVAGLVGFGVSYLVSGKANAPAPVACKSKDTCVNLLGEVASPNTLAVTVGSYVTFNSADGKSHELTIGGGDSEHSHNAAPGTFDSGVFKSDESWRVQFKNEGTYTFVDKFNPKVSIVVIVYTAGKDYKVQ